MNNYKLLLLLITISTLILNCENNEVIIEEKNEPFDKNVKVIAVQEDIIWVGTFGNGIYKLEEESWLNYTTENGLLSNEITSLVVDNNNCIWIGTKMGVSKFQNNIWTNFTVADGLFKNDIRSLGCDKENNIWIGSSSNRVTKYDGTNFTVYHVNSEASGVSGIGHIHTITSDLEGNIWIGSCMTGLSKFNGSTWSHFVNGLHSFVEVSTCDKNGAIWIGLYTGVCRYFDGIWTKYTETDGLANSTIQCIDVDKQNNIWVGTGSGISKFNGTSWSNYTIDESLLSGYIYSLACGEDNTLWIGTFKGLLKFRPDL